MGHINKNQNLTKKTTKMEYQNWTTSYIIPKNYQVSGKALRENTLEYKSTAVSVPVKNKNDLAQISNAKKYAQILDSEDTFVETVSHDIKIAIQKARQAKGWNQKQLAEAVIVKQDIIRDYESGKAIPDNGFIAKLERALGSKLPRAPKKKKQIN